jgi:probable F420-dependent oxidoreductase
MEYGVRLPNLGLFSSPEVIAPFARKMEQLGFSALMAPDHIVFPLVPEKGSSFEKRPGETDGEFFPHKPAYECLTLLAYLAGVTSSVWLGTGVNVLPARNPLLNAKQVATIDVLSGGRVLWGVAAGWAREEWANLGTDDLFDVRGDVTDEAIELFKQVCSGEEISFQGRYARVSNTVSMPPTPQRPHPPILVGANPGQRRTLTRAALLGDGWYPLQVEPEHVRESLSFIGDLRSERGLPTDAYIVCVGILVEYGAERRDRLSHWEGPVLKGPRDQVLEQVAAYRDAGVTLLVLGHPGVSDLATLESTLERFAADIM